jgi:arylsulfatase A-like enzyme
MGDSQISPAGKALAILVGVLIGFLVGDIVILLVRVPGLLSPSHWSGLGALLGSAAVLYIAIGLYFLGFYVVVWVISRILRMRFTSATVAVITVFGAPACLMIQDKLQRRMLGAFMSLKEPYFYVPTAIVLAILVAAMIVIHLASRYSGQRPAWVRGLFDWRVLMVLACAVLLVYGLGMIDPINVLGVFSDDQERKATMESPPGTVEKAAPGSPNFIVLTIECFRRDEFTKDNAPFLWKLAQENIWFPDYFVVSAATRPSVTSLFTSLYPAQHGCYNLALSTQAKGKTTATTSVVAKTVQTFPMLLQERGYRTLMTTTVPLTMDPMFGFENVYYRFDATEPYHFRFPSFDAFVGFRILKLSSSGWRVFKVILLQPEHSRLYFDSPRVNRTIERELTKHVTGEDDRPFLLYVHYVEPHAPYYHHPYRVVQLNLYSPGRRESILDAYRSEISAVDQSIADLYGYLEENGLLENTYLFVTADHGEEFYDHGDWGHGKSVYPEVVGVPGILVLPGEEKAARRIDSIVENIDVMPTFAELAGVPAPLDWEGRSAVSLIRGEAGGEVDTTAGVPGVAFAQFSDERLHSWASVVTGGWQMIFREPLGSEQLPREERLERRRTLLFDLTDDPLAKRNLYGKGVEQESELVGLLDSTLTRLEATAHLFRGERDKIDPTLRDQFKALGYIQ